MGNRPHRQSSLRTRLGIIALVFLVMVLVAVGLSALMIRSWDRALDRRGDARAAAVDVAELSLSLSDQESGIRGYLLSNDPSFLDPYLDGALVEAAIVDRLLEHDLDLPGYTMLVDGAVDAGERWRADVAEPILADVSTAPPDELAQQRFVEVRAALDELDAAVVSHADELAEEARRMQRNVIGVLFLSALAAIFGTALAASLFRRWVLQPLAAIGRSARALSHDDTARLPHFDAPELQDVSDAVEQLQRSLRSARDDAVSALDGLEQSAVLAIQVRSELADEIGEMPDGWSAHTLLVPAVGVVAGDCFDIGLLDARRMYIVLIDVTGHGAGAALNALKAKSQMRAALRSRRSPGAALEWLSREMLKDDRADLLTTSVVVVELSTGRITYANAGHPPPMLTNGVETVLLDRSGPLVGAFPSTWSTHEATIEPGWTLLAHTDGLTDTIGDDRERFGDDRLLSCLTTADPAELLDGLHEAAEAFRVGDRSDDLTAIALHRSLPDIDDDHETERETDGRPQPTTAAMPPTPGNGTITP